MDTLAAAVAAHQAGDLDGAERGYRNFPDRPAAWRNLGVLCYAQGRLEEAETAFRSALHLAPHHAPSRHGLSLALLAQGRYAEGWEAFEARRDDPAGGTRPTAMPCPEWAGEPLEGKTIIVVGDQGFGDQIMFARFLPRLVTLGAELVFLTDPATVPLFRALPVRVVSALSRAEASAASCWTYLCSLPRRLGVTLETLPPPVDLKIATTRGGGVGIVARGRPTHWNDGHRSLPPPAAAWLLSMGRDLHPDATGAADFRESAELVASLDLIVSVDTSAAHLAATMGKPTIVLLPRIGVDWRWRHGLATSPWYPSTTLIHQGSDDDWSTALAAVEARIRALATDRP
jgi:hypothetical protein